MCTIRKIIQENLRNFRVITFKSDAINFWLYTTRCTSVLRIGYQCYRMNVSFKTIDIFKLGACYIQWFKFLHQQFIKFVAWRVLLIHATNKEQFHSNFSARHDSFKPPHHFYIGWKFSIQCHHPTSLVVMYTKESQVQHKILLYFMASPFFFITFQWVIYV